MTEQMKQRLKELKEIAESERTEAQKSELGMLLLIEKQEKQLEEKQTFIGTQATELGDLRKKLEDAKPADKEGIEKQITEKEDIISALKEALQIAKEANEKLAKEFTPNEPGHGETVDQKTVDALEDKLLEADGGKDAMEAAFGAMTPDEQSKFVSDISFRQKVMKKALTAVGSEETELSPWRKKGGDKGTPSKTEKERLDELFDAKKRQHRKLFGGGGGGAIRRDLSGQPESERPVDTRTS
jgi:DNA repair exonuclease SbcCD ATPase subunit